MATADKLQQIIDNNEVIIVERDAVAQAIRNKGVSVPDNTKVEALPTYVDQIQQGGAIEPIITVTPTEARQEIRPSEGYDGIAGVDVAAIQTEQVEIAPTEEVQVVVPTAGKYFNEVTVPAIPTPEPSEYYIRKLIIKQGEGFVEELIPIKAGQTVDLGVGEDVAEAEELNLDWNPDLTWQAWSCAYEIIDNKLTLPTQLIEDIDVDAVYTPIYDYALIIEGAEYKILSDVTDFSSYGNSLLRAFIARTSVDSLFRGFTNIISATIPQGVTKISYTFYGCPALQYVTTPTSVTTHESGFYQCFALKRAVVNYGATILNHGYFLQCYTLDRINLPITLTSIANRSFESLRIKTVRSLPLPWAASQFQNNTKFNADLKFSSGIIPSRVCQGCSSLSFLRLEAHITIIGGYSFERCYSLRVVVCEPTTPPNLYSTDDFKGSLCVFLVPPESLQAYLDATNWAPYGVEGRILPNTAENRAKFGVK